MSFGPITTHVLDTARGAPAAGVHVSLDLQDGDGWRRLGAGATDADGRLRDLLPIDHRLAPGTYRLTFASGDYYATCGVVGFYPAIQITFVIGSPDQHYHVPLLLSPFGYSTYRGT